MFGLTDTLFCCAKQEKEQLNLKGGGQVREKLSMAQSAGPVSITGSPPEWPEVLAVYAVRAADRKDRGKTSLVEFDAVRLSQLQEVFDTMTLMTSEVITQGVPDSHPDDDGNDGYAISVLCIRIGAMSPADAAEQFGFNRSQKRLLTELLQERETLEGLVG